MNFLSQIPNELTDLFKSFEESDLSFIGVGGCVRDWIHLKKLSRDLDFEFRSQKLSVQEGLDVIKKILKSKQIVYSELPYEILKFELHGFDLELSPPRQEKSIDQNYSHHHFKAHFDLTMSYHDSFSRRDLTINAIGVELNFLTNTEKYVDPYQGIEDLKNQTLKNLSEDFFLDPVRLLRLIRFQTNWSFTVDEKLRFHLNKFNCRELSKHYLKSECLKSFKPVEFMKQLIEVVNHYQIPINDELIFIKKLNFNEADLSIDDLIVTNTINQNKNLNDLLELFHIPQKKIKSLNRYRDDLTRLNSLSENYWKNLSQISLSNQMEVQDLENLKTLKFLLEEDLWHKRLPIASHFQKLIFDMKKVESKTNREINHFDKEVRSLVLMFEGLKKVFHE